MGNRDQGINIFWFQRDLRLEDNHGLYQALKGGKPVIPLFIYDTSILSKPFDADSNQAGYLHSTLNKLEKKISTLNSVLLVIEDTPLNAFRLLLNRYKIDAVFTNHDYEPDSIIRNKKIKTLLHVHGIQFLTYKDQVLFEGSEILKPDGKPYQVFSPYSKNWKSRLASDGIPYYPSENHLGNLFSFSTN